VAIDSAGDCYVAGISTAITPTSGVFQTDPKSGQFVEKFGPTGSVVYATYLGGSGPDMPSGLAVDDAGNAYLTGQTASNDFPTKNALQSTFGGGTSDAFVAVLNPTASALVYSTYLGGSGQDYGSAIAVDSSSNAYVTGTTYSTNFPTVAAFQPSLVGLQAAFVTKLDASGTPVYSTYLGPTGGSDGTDSAYGSGIAADSSGNAYVTGGTGSSDFPLVNPLQSTYEGSAFVSKFNPAGSALVYSTFFGNEISTDSIAVDSSGQAYLIGRFFAVGSPAGGVPIVSPIASTPSTPITSSAVGFVSVINSAGTSIVFSSYLPGQSLASSIAVDSSENIYLGEAGTPVPILNAYNGIFSDQVGHVEGGCGSDYDLPFALKIAPTGGPVLAVPTAVPFSYQVPVGSSSGACSENVLLANASSSGTVNITNIATTGDFTQTNDCPSALTAATSCIVQVTFAPTAAGLRTGTLTITDDQPGSPQVVQVSGTGLAPQVTLTPSSLTFPAQRVGTTSSAQVVTLTNAGGAALTIRSISISGDFSETNNCGQGVGANSSCQISVTFTPTATGARNGTLSITDSAPGSPQTVALTGTGGAGFAVAPASGQQSSQTISPGQSAQFNLSVTSTFGFSGTVNLACTLAPVVTPDPTCSLFLRKLRRSPLSGIAIVAVAMVLAGCGGGNSTSHTMLGTPAGTYKATITAQSGSLSNSMTLTVVVQ
jgi:hypothetical protein